MSGIVVIERRDLDRLLKGLIHAQQRDDVKVDIKFYVQFSTGEEMAVQTLVDPWQQFTRAKAKDLVKQAIATLDAEEKKSAVNNVSDDPNLKANEAEPDAGAEPVPVPEVEGAEIFAAADEPL